MGKMIKYIKKRRLYKKNGNYEEKDYNNKKKENINEEKNNYCLQIKDLSWKDSIDSALRRYVLRRLAKHNFHLFQNEWKKFIKGKKFYKENALLNFFALVNYEHTPITNEEFREISGGNLNIKKWNGPVMSIKGKKYGDIHFPECPREYKEQDVKNEFQNFRRNNILKK